MSFQLDPQTRKVLEKRRKKIKEQRLAIRVLALLWLDDGRSEEEVLQLLDISRRTLRDWLKIYRKKGLDALLTLHHRGDPGDLTPAQEEQIKQEVHSGRFRCARQVVDYVAQTFDRHYSLSGIKRLLQRLGCSYHQVSGFFFKAKRSLQEEFVAQYETQRPAPGSRRRRYFVDGVHPVWGLEVLYSCWLLRGQRLPVGVGGGRKRWNILGAYCPEDQEYLDRRYDKLNLNAQSVIDLMLVMEGLHPETLEFILYLDNARYQHAKMLREWIANHEQQTGVRFVLAHIPAYSPNLNLIERLWKFLRKHALQTWHNSFADMQAAISRVLDNLASYREELTTLMTEKFHLVPEVEAAAAVAG